MKKIFITGCAKSGTTLVRRLFNAFDLKVYNYGEITPQAFMTSDWNVGKRDGPTPFSSILSDNEVERILTTLKGSYIINVLRNKEDVLKSDNNYVSEGRYDSCIKQADKFKDKIDYTIIYEELLDNPNKIQQEILQKFNLKYIHPFSDYPKFINIEEENEATKNGIYKLRPIGGKK